ncbi:hypothetical protein SBI_04691 [Streptomyces bingchenggensis BCW-1]|uniref:Uncharacterized protein n=1 Tax=Streptomyces bingchenggensis (strain BCW-1) TaxID=749414 RepID=D7BZ75_STRBB|nr:MULTISPECIES: hypothetical protein [Streptomyces]ADI07811.1 hypothetical protein SBI_04691 [Streptomyces bingchenggensis BCW-1]
MSPHISHSAVFAVAGKKPSAPEAETPISSETRRSRAVEAFPTFWTMTEGSA